jgi:SAM-dependent methyltransferase
MDFKYKNALQHIFSILPFGHRFNYFFQRFITKSYPSSADVFEVKVEQGMQHFNNFKEFNTLKEKSGAYYEFGAGWDLIIPLLMSSLKFKVHCIDLRKLLALELINDSINKFNRSHPEAISPQKKISSIEELKINGIHYFAPLDARNTGFEANTFDFMSSTSTMEHIPPKDIQKILIECERILKPGGILSMLTDYKDHWSYFDSSIGIYNFLKYSSAEWKRYNPNLHYQNRLRHSDYISIIQETDFEIVKETFYNATEAQSASFNQVVVSKEFSSYTPLDLRITGSEIVLRKKSLS